MTTPKKTCLAIIGGYKTIIEGYKTIIEGYKPELSGLDDEVVLHLAELSDLAELTLELRTLFLKSLAAREDEEDSAREGHADLIKATDAIAQKI